MRNGLCLVQCAGGTGSSKDQGNCRGQQKREQSARENCCGYERPCYGWRRACQFACLWTSNKRTRKQLTERWSSLPSCMCAKVVAELFCRLHRFKLIYSGEYPKQNWCSLQVWIVYWMYSVYGLCLPWVILSLSTCLSEVVFDDNFAECPANSFICLFQLYVFWSAKDLLV